MEAKKSKEANLENKIVVFRSVGLVMVSAIVLMAFTATSAVIDEKVAVETEKDKGDDDALYDLIIEQPEPEQEEVVVPPPPAPEEVIIEEDDVEIEEVKWNDDPIGDPPKDDDDDGKLAEEPITDFSDTEPVFPGGPAAMNAFIQSKVVYPELSREMDEQGTVYVQFVVNTNGSIQDVIILKGVSDLLDKEAVRVVRLMPPWTPGEQAGKKVRVRYQVPINFKIQ